MVDLNSSTSFIEFEEIYNKCINIFEKKNNDYGTSWTFFRVSSLIDQTYIKALRIRTIEDKGGKQMIEDDVTNDYIGIINYSIMTLIKIDSDSATYESDALLDLYKKLSTDCFMLMDKKNHDYGSAWRILDIKTITDLIIVKLVRIKQILNNGGKTEISENIQSNIMDIINYAYFAIRKIDLEKLT